MMKAARALVFTVLGPRGLVPEAAADWWIVVVDVRLHVRAVSHLVNCILIGHYYLSTLEVRQRIGLSGGVGSIRAQLPLDCFEVESRRVRHLLLCILISSKLVRKSLVLQTTCASSWEVQISLVLNLSNMSIQSRRLPRRSPQVFVGLHEIARANLRAMSRAFECTMPFVVQDILLSCIELLLGPASGLNLFDDFHFSFLLRRSSRFLFLKHYSKYWAATLFLLIRCGIISIEACA